MQSSALAESHLDPADAEGPAVHRAARRRDVPAVMLLAGWSMLFHGIGLGALEFFRHTEADRSLIAWEMVERGEYLVPHLLGSEILTKPPLFYWLLAGVFQLTGEVSEFSARLLPFGCAVLFVIAQYVFLRAARCSVELSLLGAFCLSSSVSFFILASVAEIDMLFGLLCAASLYASYLSTERGQGILTVAAYLAVALAFLAKGPPAVVFFALPHAGYFLLRRFKQPGAAAEFVRWNLLGGAAAAALIGLWLLLLASEVGWQALAAQFRTEILERILSESSRNRGPFFYAKSVFAMLGHWSVFPIAAAALAILERDSLKKRWCALAEQHRRLLIFSLLTVGWAVLVLSLAEGKSNRYLFPVHAFLVIVAVLCAVLIRGSSVESWLLKPFAVVFGFVCAAGVLLAPLLINVPHVSIGTMYTVGVPMALALLVISLGGIRRSRILVVAGVVAAVFGVRLGQAEIFAPHRNAVKSVRPAVKRLHAALPAGAPLYTVEMFERWVVYYLKQRGRSVSRLTPKLAENLSKSGERVFLLLNEKEEGWRVRLLRPHDDKLRVVARINRRNEELLLLVDVAASALPVLEPRALFPTMPTKPPPHLRPRARAANRVDEV